MLDEGSRASLVPAAVAVGQLTGRSAAGGMRR
jgi:hypothetical protein